MPAHTRTVCLEFFGDVALAVPAIVEITRRIDGRDGVALAGLEHLDERYVKAVGYATKAKAHGRPRMVLIGDLVSDDENAVSQAASEVVRIANARGGEGFIAATPEARKRFWMERARTAAIAKHTNAFKVNEDVVIPLERLADYTNGVERLNVEYSIGNKLKLAAALEARLSGDLPVETDGEALAREDVLGDRPSRALELVRFVKERWSFLQRNLDRTLGEVRADLAPWDWPTRGRLPGRRTVFSLVQLHELRVSWKRELRDPLRQIFAGRAFEPVMARLQAIHAEVLRGRVFVALHMHAGDGNVHTNIPVNSDDYEMLRTANEAVAHIMRFARELGGVVSGEHGIGITKLEFLDQEQVEAFAAWKAKVDPEGRFNRGKLLPGADLSNAYTPSFALIGHESLILERSDIGSIADSVKDCLRCGKCKPVCATHVPRANLLYSPRNKILALSLLTEAFLYEEQTRRGVSLRHFDEFGDVADHCTVCHKCEAPCPVDIDFGNVSIAMRGLLTKLGKKRFNPGSALSMAYLNATDPATIKVLKTLMIDWGYKAQRLAHRIARRFLVTRGQTRRPPATVGKPALKAQVIHFINKPMPGNLPKKTARALLDIEDASIVPIIRDPAKVTEESDAVFYFPGCGSERLFGKVGLATQALLYHVGAQCVLPPGYLCCGYPQTASGQQARARRSRFATGFSSTASPIPSTTSTSRRWSCPAARAWTR